MVRAELRGLWRRARIGVTALAGFALLIAAQALGGEPAGPQWEKLAPFFKPPAEMAGDFGGYDSPLAKAGGEIATAEEWTARRAEILKKWRMRLGDWPPLLEKPAVRILETEHRDNYTQHRMMLQVAPAKGSSEPLETNAILMIPDGDGPFPAVLVTFYEPLSSAGLMKEMKGHHDYGRQLAKRGYVTLSIGTPGSRNFGKDTRPALNEIGRNYECQPLGFLAYVAANCHTALTQRPEVDRNRIGVVGLSYGGKWSMFASCLYDKFQCAVWADPGIVFDESNRNINYYEPWYLGFNLRKPFEFDFGEPWEQREPGVPSEKNPRTGLYREMMEGKEQLVDLHALMAPRPVLVSGGTEDKPERWKALNHLVRLNKLLGRENIVGLTARETHVPDANATEQTCDFFDVFLKPLPADAKQTAAEPEKNGTDNLLIPVSDEALTDAVQRGLVLLRKGAANYPKNRDCFSCHHQTLPLLASSLSRESPKDGSGPTRADFAAEVAKFTHKSFAGKHESLREGTGIGGRALTVGYGLWTLDLADWKRDETTDAMVEYLLKTQQKDGHWDFHSYRPPASSSVPMTSALAVFGLQAYGPDAVDKGRLDAALLKAAEWFAKPEPKTHEDLIGAIWGQYLLADELRKIGKEAEGPSLNHRLWNEQRSDGGWSQEVGMPSDAYATGTALMMIAQTSYAEKRSIHHRDDFQRGVSFLLNTQLPDGSWHVKTRAKPVQVYFDNGDPHGKDQFLSIMATGWAVSALANTLDHGRHPLDSKHVRQRGRLEIDRFSEESGETGFRKRPVEADDRFTPVKSPKQSSSGSFRK